jgi:hypothetical protein
VRDGEVTDEEPEPGAVWVFDRLLAAGLSVERIEAHLAAGRVHVDGEPVTDSSPSAPWTVTRWEPGPDDQPWR